MDFFNNMDNTQKLMLAAGVTLVIAVIIYFYSRKNNAEGMQQIVEQESPQDVAPPRSKQHHQQLPPRPVNNGVLVMFFAPWCGHCKTTEPIWDELTQNFDGYNGVRIIKVNGQEAPDLCQNHSVSGFPTIKYCPNGLEDSNGIVYQGDRSIASLAQFLQQNA